jgi:uncharacterized protein YgiM (DUF1202 family)
MKIPFLMLALLSVACTVHAESASTVRATELQAESRSDAETLSKLSANTKVDVLRRQGAWTEVKLADGKTGWVRMLSLKFGAEGAASSSSSGNPLSALGGLLSAGRTSNSGTGTTAARGLTAEDLQNAEPNPDELAKMQKFAINKSAAETFAKNTPLMTVKVEYLPNPSRAKESNSGGE